MSPSLRLLAVAVCAGSLFACAKKPEDKKEDVGALTTDAQKFGYAIGVDLGSSLQPVRQHVDIAALKQGLDDAAAAQARLAEARKALEAKPDDAALKTALEEAEKLPGVKLDAAAREQIKSTVSKKMQEEQLKARAEQGAKAKAEGEAFLAENAKKEGVKVTASGLQYKVITEGKGESPKASDRVTVHYRGTLINGEEFDSSYSRGQPVTFPLANVIPGWTEGLQLMKPGAKYQFFIPPNLGYGERGAGVKIGPNEVLVFEVELIDVPKDEGAKKK